jgi:hypothetical protein
MYARDVGSIQSFKGIHVTEDGPGQLLPGGVVNSGS